MVKRCYGVMAVVALSGCSSTVAISGWRGRLEYGYGEPVALGDAINHMGTGLPIDLHFARASVGAELGRAKDFSLDLFGGAWGALPEDHESSAAGGISIQPRIVYSGLGDWRPYVGVNLGLGFARWEKHGSEFGFLVGPSLGVQYRLSEKVDLTVSWDLFHLSNAGLAHDNPGLNADLVLVGIEYRFW